MSVLIFDTETTSREPDREIIEAAWLQLPVVDDLAGPSERIPDLDGTIAGKFEQRYKPERPLTFGSIAVHHILPHELEDRPPSSSRLSLALGQMRADVTAVVQCCHALRAGAKLEEQTERSATRRRKFVDEVSGIVSADYFYRADHRRIFLAMKTLQERGGDSDALTVIELLNAQGELSAGGGEYLAQLVRDVPSVANAGDYARTVRDRWAKRELIQFMAAMSLRALNDHGVTAQEIIEDAARRVSEIADAYGI